MIKANRLIFLRLYISKMYTQSMQFDAGKNSKIIVSNISLKSKSSLLQVYCRECVFQSSLLFQKQNLGEKKLVLIIHKFKFQNFFYEKDSFEYCTNFTFHYNWIKKRTVYNNCISVSLIRTFVQFCFVFDFQKFFTLCATYIYLIYKLYLDSFMQELKID